MIYPFFTNRYRNLFIKTVKFGLIMKKYDVEELILSMVDIVVENRQLRQEEKDGEKWKENFMIISWKNIEQARKNLEI